MPTFHYTVDDEPQVTSEHQLTAAQIMSLAGIDPACHYLVEIEGNHRKSYEGKADEAVHMHEHAKFISVSTGPTPVS